MTCSAIATLVSGFSASTILDQNISCSFQSRQITAYGTLMPQRMGRGLQLLTPAALSLQLAPIPAAFGPQLYPKMKRGSLYNG